jgi:hypothetical protein
VDIEMLTARSNATGSSMERNSLNIVFILYFGVMY